MSNYADELAVSDFFASRPEADPQTEVFYAPRYTNERLAELRRIHNIPDEPPF